MLTLSNKIWVCWAMIMKQSKQAIVHLIIISEIFRTKDILHILLISKIVRTMLEEIKYLFLQIREYLIIPLWLVHQQVGILPILAITSLIQATYLLLTQLFEGIILLNVPTQPEALLLPKTTIKKFIKTAHNQAAQWDKNQLTTTSNKPEAQFKMVIKRKTLKTSFTKLKTWFPTYTKNHKIVAITMIEILPIKVEQI